MQRQVEIQKECMMAIGELVKMAEEKRKADIRKGVLNAVLKVYTAREMAKLDACPLCGRLIEEYTWTITNFEKGQKPIGISGVQCANESCLLHNGIIYEDEGKRLAEWQGQLKEWVNKDFKGDEKSLKKEQDPDRWKNQLLVDREKIEDVTTLMEVVEDSVNPAESGKTMRFKMKLKSMRAGRSVHASSLGRSMLTEIEDLGYTITWVDADWQEQRITIIIQKEVPI